MHSVAASDADPRALKASGEKDPRALKRRVMQTRRSTPLADSATGVGSWRLGCGRRVK